MCHCIWFLHIKHQSIIIVFLRLLVVKIFHKVVHQEKKATLKNVIYFRS